MSAPTRIPIVRPYLDEKEVGAIARVVRSGWIAQGAEVAAFEQAFAEMAGTRFAIATSSWTTGAFLVLKSMGIGPGDEVIVPSYSFIATANVVRHAGAEPVFVDIDPRTYNIDPGRIAGAVTAATKAIIPVHQAGMPCDIESVSRIAKGNGLAVLEDAACAAGSKIDRRPVGSLGNVACWSFHPRKLITTGEGGMVTTDDEALAGHLRSMRAHGVDVPPEARHGASNVVIDSYPQVGYNFRMTDMQGALGRVQLAKLGEIIEKRAALAERYNEALDELDWIDSPLVPENVTFNWQSYIARMPASGKTNRDELMARLLERGISTRRGIMAIHREPPYRDARRRGLTETERAADETIALPLYPQMTPEEQDRVLDALSEMGG